MNIFRTTKGSRVVVTTQNDHGSFFFSRLYVNNGETPTLSHAEHKTKVGADKWAATKLA